VGIDSRKRSLYSDHHNAAFNHLAAECKFYLFISAYTCGLDRYHSAQKPINRKEDLMIAKILIKRRFVKGKENEIRSLLRDFRSGAMDMEGYISGETLLNYNDPRTLLVIATWDSIEQWHLWREAPARKQFEAMISVYQEGPTEYEEYVLRAPFTE
jgi:heme-degrading monooxygenase HmoA